MRRGVGGWLVVTLVLAGCTALTGASDLQVVAADEAEDGGGSSETSTPTIGPSEAIDAGLDVRPRDAVDSAPPIDGGPDVTGPSLKRVFASSATYDGNLGGLAGADARCNQLAKAAGLGGTFVAWLSTGASFARDRLTGEGPWSLVGESDVAVVKAEVTNPPLTKPIGRDELGNPVSGLVWTGTSASGRGVYDDCEDWMSAVPLHEGAVGDTANAGSSWTAAGTPPDCDRRHRLYCFEL